MVDLPATHDVSLLRAEDKSLKHSLNEAANAQKQALMDEEKALEEKFKAKLNISKPMLKIQLKSKLVKALNWDSFKLFALQTIGSSPIRKTI